MITRCFAGAPIIYRGIAIGQITDLQFSNGRKDIVALAAIEPVFSDMLTTGSHFILEEAKKYRSLASRM